MGGSVVPVFWTSMLLLVLAIPFLYWTSTRFPPAWRSVLAYVALMAFCVVALRLV